ncbi:hypothetical protein ACQY1Q_06000 [Tenacibaculum sp. TC6]
MTDQEKIKEYYNRYVNSIIKYCYYLLGLAVASIGYIVNLTKDKKLDFDLISLLLIISVLCWLFSIFLGLLYIRLNLSVDFYRTTYYVKKKNIPKDLTRIQLEEELKKIEHLYSNSKRSNRMIQSFRWQTIVYFSGVLFFVLWNFINVFS